VTLQFNNGSDSEPSDCDGTPRAKAICGVLRRPEGSNEPSSPPFAIAEFEASRCFDPLPHGVSRVGCAARTVGEPSQELHLSQANMRKAEQDAWRRGRFVGTAQSPRIALTSFLLGALQMSPAEELAAVCKAPAPGVSVSLPVGSDEVLPQLPVETKPPESHEDPVGSVVMHVAALFLVVCIVVGCAVSARSSAPPAEETAEEKAINDAIIEDFAVEIAAVQDKVSAAKAAALASASSGAGRANVMRGKKYDEELVLHWLRCCLRGLSNVQKIAAPGAARESRVGAQGQGSVTCLKLSLCRRLLRLEPCNFGQVDHTCRAARHQSPYVG
jgi:hypothetical protein